MYFVIPSALVNETNRTSITVILHFAYEGATFIKLGNKDDAQVEAWLENCSKHDKERWKTVIAASVKAESKFRSIQKIIVTTNNINSNWNTDPPVINLNDAVTLAGQSKQLILENSRADRSFLLIMSDDQLRKKLLRLEEKGRINYSHGGGNGELRKQLTQKYIKIHGYKYICWVLFDSDSTTPGMLSVAAQQLLNECKKHDFKYHCLNRRAIENYIPKSAMLQAIDKSILTEEDRIKIEEFFNLPDSFRHHFHLKKGGSLPNLTKSNNKNKSSVKSNLKYGFGDSISRIYDVEDDKLGDLGDQFSQDGCTEELKDSFIVLKSMIRGLI